MSVQNSSASLVIKETLSRLALAVGRGPGRATTPPSVRVILTADVRRSAASEHDRLVLISQETFDAALEQLRLRAGAAEGNALSLGERLLDRPWFDIRIGLESDTLTFSVSRIHLVAA